MFSRSVFPSVLASSPFSVSFGPDEYGSAHRHFRLKKLLIYWVFVNANANIMSIEMEKLLYPHYGFVPYMLG